MVRDTLQQSLSTVTQASKQRWHLPPPGEEHHVHHRGKRLGFSNTGRQKAQTEGVMVRMTLRPGPCQPHGPRCDYWAPILLAEVWVAFPKPRPSS